MNALIEKAKTGVLALFGSQSRLSYRRLLVFGIGTYFVMLGTIESSDWLYLALAYIGSDAAEKTISAFRRG